MNFILASKSPRRKKLLKRLNKSFKIIDPEIDESKISKNINPMKYCSTLASMKASSVSDNHYEELVIGADTIVVFNDQIIGKPKNRLDALDILTKLSGNHHSVFTGICLKSKKHNINHIFTERTDVLFEDIDKKEIEFYIDNYNPYDKAGAYGIQDWSSIFVKEINGCYDNVVGFPISRLYKELKKHNINLLDTI